MDSYLNNTLFRYNGYKPYRSNLPHCEQLREQDIRLRKVLVRIADTEQVENVDPLNHLTLSYRRQNKHRFSSSAFHDFFQLVLYQQLECYSQIGKLKHKHYSQRKNSYLWSLPNDYAFHKRL